MMKTQKVTKKQIIKAIQELENNPHSEFDFLADIGIGAVGAVSTGTIISTFGGTSILFGLITLAPPVGLVVGGAALGSAALVGAKRILFDGTFIAGKEAEMLRQLKDLLRKVEAKEKVLNIDEANKNQLYLSLRELTELNLITPAKAQQLIYAVEKKSISMTEAIDLLTGIIEAASAN